MDAPAQQRARIPETFLKPSLWQTFAIIFRALCIWLIPAACTLTVARSQSLSPATKILLAAPLCLLAGQGLHLLGIIGHDGSHATLHRDRLKSFLIGNLVSSIMPMHCGTGFAVSHADHHRWVNTDRDPDAVLLSQFRSRLARVFLVRSIATKNYLRYTLRLALNRWPKDHVIRVSLPFEKLVFLARVNLAMCLSWLSFFLFVTWKAPIVGVSLLWGPYIGVALLSAMRVYVEHAGTSSEKYSAARTYTHPLLTFLFGGANYHLAHHLIPTVPCYRLPAFHEWLKQRGDFDEKDLHLDPTFFGYLSYVGNDHHYPGPHAVVQEAPPKGALQPG